MQFITFPYFNSLEVSSLELWLSERVVLSCCFVLLVLCVLVVQTPLLLFFGNLLTEKPAFEGSTLSTTHEELIAAFGRGLHSSTPTGHNMGETCWNLLFPVSFPGFTGVLPLPSETVNFSVSICLWNTFLIFFIVRLLALSQIPLAAVSYHVTWKSFIVFFTRKKNVPVYPFIHPFSV